MTRLANLQLQILKHAVDQLDRLVAHPRQPSCGAAGIHAAVAHQETLIARHARDFGWLARLHLDPDATAYEIGYALRRHFERPARPLAQLRIRDLVGVRLARGR